MLSKFTLEFFNWVTYLNVLQFELEFDHTGFFTAMFMPIIYERLEICAENLLLLCPHIIARLSTETAAFVYIQLFDVGVFANVHFCFLSRSFSPSLASQSFF